MLLQTAPLPGSNFRIRKHICLVLRALDDSNVYWVASTFNERIAFPVELTGAEAPPAFGTLTTLNALGRVFEGS